ncbi:MAG: ABC transporter substrate-binding protein [Actinobacteria bacterium]|nr:ABC transporter substrate-binding protein [Actinomycetota bacterium]
MPGPGEISARAPGSIEIGFTERVILKGSSMRLVGPDGTEVALGPLRKPKAGEGMAADVKGALSSAVYTVKWATVGDDGHGVEGDFRFGIAAADGSAPPGAEQLNVTGGPGSQNQQNDGPFRLALRWAGLLGASLFLGGSVLASRLRGRLDPDAEAAVAARWRTLGRLGWVVAAAGAAGAVVASGASGSGDTGLGLILASSTGRLALIQLAVVAAAAVPALLRPPSASRDNMLGAVGALYLGAEAAGGHVAALTSWQVPAGLAQAVHLASGAIWVGGMLTLAFAVWAVAPERRVAAWRVSAAAFGPVAAVSAVLVVLTGTLAAIREVDHVYFLRWSTYGRYLLVKLVLVAAMLALGGAAAWTVRRGGGTSLRRRTVPRVEAVLGMAVLILAATLAGNAQGRGRPLPAQRESVLAGPAFANAVVAGGLAQMMLAPAAPGANRFMVLLRSPEDEPGERGGAGANETARSAAVTEPQMVEATLRCTCTKQVVRARLTKQSGAAWAGDLTLPAEGIWRASLAVDGATALAPVAMRVADDAFPGAPPVVISGTADLSGRDGKRCRSYQLGLMLAVAYLNADGGVGGRKVVLASVDDAGDPALARKEVAAQRRNGVDLAAPCGPAAAAVAEALGDDVPVILGDARTPPVEGRRIYRQAADPQAEGWAVGRILARSPAFSEGSPSPRKITLVVDEGDPATDRVVAGLKGALALDPKTAKEMEQLPAQDLSDVTVDVLRRSSGAPLLPLVQSAMDPKQSGAAFLRSDLSDLGAALDQLPNPLVAFHSPVFVPTAAFDEAFIQASKLGRRGDVIALGEVAPDGGESLRYTTLIESLFAGEQSTIDGLRGYMVGKAITTVLKKGASRDGLSRRLQLLGFHSDSQSSGWSPGAPDAGSWRFFAYKATFIPSSLGAVLNDKPSPGRFFSEGAWSRVGTGSVGLCEAQTGFGQPPPPCTPRPQGQPKEGPSG